MTHYQKLATMIFRIVAVFLLIVGVSTAIIGFTASLFIFAQFGIWIGVFYSVPFTIVGILFFILSRNLARWVCFDFDRFDEK